MPSLNEVLDTFPEERCLINIKATVRLTAICLLVPSEAGIARISTD